MFAQVIKENSPYLYDSESRYLPDVLEWVDTTWAEVWSFRFPNREKGCTRSGGSKLLLGEM
jgi:hypothetical protein